MAKILDLERGEGKGYTHVRGTFFPNGSSAMTTGNSGPGWSVARTSAGLFTITLTEKYPSLVSAMATIQMNAATDLVPQWGTYTPASGSTAATITLRTNATATPTDIAANANNAVHFDLCFSTHGSTK